MNSTVSVLYLFVCDGSSSADEAWQLLQQYLDSYEDRTAQYHRCTAKKLLAHGFVLPAWFANSYKVNVVAIVKMEIIML